MTEGDWDRELYEGTGGRMNDPSPMGAAPRVRVMRGQVVVRELEVLLSTSLWMPSQGPRQVSTHRGVVLAMGEPARTRKSFDGERWVGDVPVPFGFEVGDTVQFHWEHHAEAWTMPWPPDGKPASWMPQHCIDAVIE